MKKKLKLYANLVARVAREKGNERSSKCGYDLFMGLVEGNINKRFDAWKNYLLEDDSHNSEERNGIWVPAITL